MKLISRILPGGLKVFLMPMRGVKSLTGLFVVRAGWKYETEKELHGLSHFLEHMAFKGTLKRPTSRDITAEVEGRGAIINAATSEEFIVYFIKSSSMFKEMVYDVLSDIILNPLLNQGEIDRETGTIIEEIRYGESNPAIHVSSLWPRLLYGDQPAGREGIGTVETVRGLKRDQFVGYMRQLYVASNSAVILAGKLGDAEEEVATVGKYFSNLSSCLPARNKLPVEESQAEPGFLLLPKDIEQTWICLGARAYSAQNKDKYALDLLRVILGAGMSSRLFIEVRERNGLAYSIGSHCDFQSDTGSFFTHAGLNSQKIKEAIRIILNEYGKIASERVSEEELKEAKDFIIGRKEIAAEDSRGVAVEAAMNFVLTDEVPGARKELKGYQAVTAEDILRVAQDIFRNDKLNLAMIGPHAREEEEIRRILKL